MTETRPCIRCATCCLLGPCAFGKVDKDTGVCKWLIPNNDGSASCYQIMTSVKARSHLLGKGCVMRNDHDLFQEALETTAPTRRAFFEHIDITKNNKLIGQLANKLMS